jgi:hypothetical protein
LLLRHLLQLLQHFGEAVDEFDSDARSRSRTSETAASLSASDASFIEEAICGAFAVGERVCCVASSTRFRASATERRERCVSRDERVAASCSRWADFSTPCCSDPCCARKRLRRRALSGLLLERFLLARQLDHLLDGAIEFGREFLLPLRDLLLACLGEFARGFVHRRRCLTSRVLNRLVLLSALLRLTTLPTLSALSALLQLLPLLPLLLLSTLLLLALLLWPPCRPPCCCCWFICARMLSAAARCCSFCAARSMACADSWMRFSASLTRSEPASAFCCCSRSWSCFTSSDRFFVRSANSFAAALRLARSSASRALPANRQSAAVAVPAPSPRRQRAHRAFERRAFQHLDALLELFAKLLLLLRQVGHRLASIFGRQLLRRLLEFPQLLGQFRRERFAQQLLRFIELPLQRGVEGARFLELVLELFAPTT